MSNGIIERRRVLGDSSGGGPIVAPPTPVISVFPSQGNTITISGGSGGRSIEIPNDNISQDTSVPSSSLFDMTGYSTMYSTTTAGSDYVWCYVYCPDTVGATIFVDIEYHLSNNSTQTVAFQVETTSGQFISLSAGNAFSQITNGSHPYLDTANLNYITVSSHAELNGVESLYTSFDIYIQNSTISLNAPTFNPGGGTYPDQQPVTISDDHNTYIGLETWYCTSNSPETPTPLAVNCTQLTYDIEPQVTMRQTGYLNAKSFLTVGGTTYESGTTSELYTIGNPSTTLTPPVFSPSPGPFLGSTTVYMSHSNSNGTIYYTTDGTTPTNLSQQYIDDGIGISITATTTFKAVVCYNGSYSTVTTGTYTATSLSVANSVNVGYNSDTPSTCGDFILSTSTTNGDQKSDYCFFFDCSQQQTTIYFTLDGTAPTTSSESLSNYQIYYLTKPNTTKVRWLAVAPNCADITGEFWIRINKALVTFEYAGIPLYIGQMETLNWYSATYDNYVQDNMCYVYRNGILLDPSEMSIVEKTDSYGNAYHYLTWSPPSGTQIDSKISLVYAYSSPIKDWSGSCPYSPFFVYSGIGGGYASLLTYSNSVFTNMTCPRTIWFSSNEMYTMCCSGLTGLLEVNFGGKNGENYVQPCNRKTELDYYPFVYTRIQSIDLTPCTSMTSVAEGSMADTISQTNSSETGLTSVIMPFRVAYLGPAIFVRSSSLTRRPLSVTFFSNPVPYAQTDTFIDYSSIMIDSNSTIIVDSRLGATVCNYEYAWKGTTPSKGAAAGSSGQSKTNMKIVDTDGLQCNEVPPGDPPTVVTGTASGVTATSVTISGNNVTSQGDSQVYKRGVCYSTIPSPSWPEGVSSGTGTGTFSVTLQNLQEGTTYYARAYAINTYGVSYGSEITFTTTQPASPPWLANGHIYGTNVVWTCEHLGQNAGCQVGAKVISDGGATITQRKLFMNIGTNTYPASPTPSSHQYSFSPVQHNGQYYWIDPDDHHEYFDFNVLLSNITGIPSSGHVSFSIFAQNSAGWSHYYNGYGFGYDLSSVTEYPTIQLSSPSCITSGTQGQWHWCVSSVANVTCGTYGDILVETFISDIDNVTAEDTSHIIETNNLWYHSVGQPTQTVNGDGSYTVLVNLPYSDLDPGTTYYIRCRVRQSQNNNWVYSNSLAFTVDNIQISFNTDPNVSDLTYYSAKLKASGLVTPQLPYYGILVGSQGTQPMIDTYYMRDFDILESSTPTSVTFQRTFGGGVPPFYPSTEYVFRSFVSSYVPGTTPGPNDNVIYGEIATFTTSAEPPTPFFYVKSNQSLTSSRRTPDPVNLSFKRTFRTGVWVSCYEYGWGLGGFHGDEQILEKPWDYIGNSNGNNDSNASHERDLFGWGTSSQPHRPDDYNSWSTDDTNTYYAYNSYIYSLTEPNQNGQANWGFQTYRNGNGGIYTSVDAFSYLVSVNDGSFNQVYSHNANDIWYGDVKYMDYSRVLTHSEMNHLLNNRSTQSGIRYCKGRIDHGDGTYTNGLILLGEGWRTTYYTLNQTNTASAPFTSNTITESNWNSIFGVYDRAAFLPAAGYRKKTTVYSVNSEGRYWLNDYYNSNDAYCLVFSNSNVEITHKPKYYGHSVRLWRIKKIYQE